MRIRPWHLIGCIFALSVILMVIASQSEDRLREILLGLGLNLLSSVVFFILLELYWEKIKRANGKEVNGFDYRKFARNIETSNHIRVLATFIYPFTNHPSHSEEKQLILDAIRKAILRRNFTGMEILFLHPKCKAAESRAAERKDDNLLLRMEESLNTLVELMKELENLPERYRLQIRFYSRIPALSLFQTDNFGSMSFYFRDRPISEVTRYEFFVDAPIGVFVEKTFDDLWLDKRTITLEQYLQLNSNQTNGPPSTLQTPVGVGVSGGISPNGQSGN
jgi:hypothetical protein